MKTEQETSKKEQEQIQEQQETPTTSEDESQTWVKQNERNNVKDTIESLKMNYKSWLTIFVCVLILSKNDPGKGFLSFGFMVLLAYFVHRASHDKRNLLSICHHYHHENNNVFSHFIQYILEFLSACMNYGIELIYPLGLLDNWVILFFYFFYTTLHNINYSIFHVNKIHEYHHENINTNIGPDICDVFFQSKKDAPIEHYLENTDHYIPNILFGFIMVILLRHFYEKEEWRPLMDKIVRIIVPSAFIIFMVSSIYLVKIDQKGAIYNPLFITSIDDAKKIIRNYTQLQV
jgi:hypothetical protein|tara:strand:- start:1602 stop:2471 length:870 start_codon:yes stop_codon:yes gene_type:complete